MDLQFILKEKKNTKSENKLLQHIQDWLAAAL